MSLDSRLRLASSKLVEPGAFLIRWVESAPERGVFWFAFLAYLCFWNPLYTTSVTDVNLHLAWALAHHGTPEFFGYYGVDAVIINGRIYSGVPPGSGFLAVPIAWLTSGLGSLDANAVIGVLNLLCSLVYAIPIGALTAALLTGLVRRQGVPPRLAGITGLLFALGTNHFAVSISYNKELFGVALLVATLDCLLVPTQRLSAGRSFLAGVLAGALPMFQYADAMLVVGLMLFAWWRGGWCVLGWCVLGTLPGLAMLGLYNTVAFGAPWLTGYHFPRLPYFVTPVAIAFQPLSLGRLAEVLAGPRGFFVGSPAAVLGLIGWLYVLRRRPAWRPLAVLVLGNLLLYAVFYSVYGYSGSGGPFLGWRFLYILLPLLAIGIPEGLAIIPRWLGSALGAISLAMAYLTAQTAHILYGLSAKGAYVYMTKVLVTTLGGGVFFADLLPPALGIPTLHRELPQVLNIMSSNMSWQAVTRLLPLVLWQLLFALLPLLVWGTAAAVTASLLWKCCRAREAAAVGGGEVRLA